MPSFQIRRLPSAALITLLLLSACTSPEVDAARSAQIQKFQNDIEAYTAAALSGDKAAKYQVCFASYRVATIVRPSTSRKSPVTDQAWEWCSSSAKDGQRHAQYITAYLLTHFQPSYSWDMEGPQRYAEAVYWYKQSMDQGYAPARDLYVYYKDWYEKEYGSKKSDLFGKVLAGAFVAGVGVYAKAGAATTAGAVSAFAADASTQGRAQASANFMQNAGGAQQTPKTDPSSLTQHNSTSTSATPPYPANRAVAAVNPAANARLQQPEAAAPKAYSCPAEEKKVVDVVGRSKDTEDGWSSSTDSLACEKAHRRAVSFADDLANPGFLGRSGKVTAIELCSFKEGYGDRRYALVTVRYLYESSIPCDAAPNDVSR